MDVHAGSCAQRGYRRSFLPSLCSTSLRLCHVILFTHLSQMLLETAGSRNISICLTEPKNEEAKSQPVGQRDDDAQRLAMGRRWEQSWGDVTLICRLWLWLFGGQNQMGFGEHPAALHQGNAWCVKNDQFISHVSGTVEQRGFIPLTPIATSGRLLLAQTHLQSGEQWSWHYLPIIFILIIQLALLSVGDLLTVVPRVLGLQLMTENLEGHQA